MSSHLSKRNAGREKRRCTSSLLLLRFAVEIVARLRENAVHVRWAADRRGSLLLALVSKSISKLLARQHDHHDLVQKKHQELLVRRTSDNQDIL